MRQIVGRTEFSSDHILFKWEIENISIKCLLGETISSPWFDCCNMKFHLELSHTRSPDRIHLRLVQSACDYPHRIEKIQIGLYYSDDPDNWFDTDATANSTAARSTSFTTADIRENFLAGDALTARCEILASMPIYTLDASQSEIKEKDSDQEKYPLLGYSTLAKNIGSIIDTSKFSDVALKVGEDTFQAHRAILASRSRVFDSMFGSGMKEGQEGVVQVVEMKPCTLREMLQYIYSGEIEKLSMDRAMDLYTAADRYDLQELRRWCRDYIIRNVSADDVCDVAVLADLHRDEELIKASRRVFKQESKVVLMSQGWRDFSKNHTSVYIDLVEFILNDS